MDSETGLNSELEFFREQWLSEVRTKRLGHPSAQPQPAQHSRAPAPGEASSSIQPPLSPRRFKVRPASPTDAKRPVPVTEDDDEYAPTRPFDEVPEPSGHTLDGSVSSSPGKELVSALDHYEEAMEKEAQGNMGDSLKLYRRAYRLDNRVDRRYREKHFPQGHAAKQPVSTAHSSSTVSTAVTSNPVPSTSTSTSTSTPGQDAVLLPIKDLIASFAGLKIEPAPASVESTPPPPCPISQLPGELLIHIMQDVATADIGDFARLSLVCKRFAYLVATEQRIWRQVSLGDRFGFPGMRYHWNKTIHWEPLDDEQQPQDAGDGTLISMRELAERRVLEQIALTKSLVPKPYATWKQMFRSRPRIRFNGCYISTVNYVRTGQASTNQSTWGGAPIHIVTYYRYLRFYRDGTAISLCTTTEPSAVVHHLTPDNVHLHRDNAHAYLPSAFMSRAFKGRWRLSSALENEPTPAQNGYGDAGPVGSEEEPAQEGDLTIETEGVDPKYMYRMDLSFRTAGKGAKNNKVVWRSFFSYNRLTDDWAEFTLKHDKPFFFSRVRSYGTGD